MATTTWTDDQLRVAVATSSNISQTLRRLGLRPRGGNYDTIRRRVAELQLDTTHWRRYARRHATRQEMLAAVAASDTVRSATQRLGWTYSGSAPQRFKQLAAEYGIDTSHFLGQASRRGKQCPERTVPVTAYLVNGGGSRIKSVHLKKRLIEAGILPAQCYGCERWEWLSEPIPLELDHINGDRTDNRLENLRLLCPNCHAFTGTYRGRNIGNARYARP